MPPSTTGALWYGSIHVLSLVLAFMDNISIMFNITHIWERMQGEGDWGWEWWKVTEGDESAQK
jgi:hypothetical protein